MENDKQSNCDNGKLAPSYQKPKIKVTEKLCHLKLISMSGSTTANGL